ncbi:MAG: hypothetical protein ABSG25_02330 [Bryobacteraceae bacterium]
MSDTLVSTYLTDRNGHYSLMNLNIKQYLTTNDYTEVIVSDKYEYRFDLIAQDYMGVNSNEYYFFLFWVNQMYDFEGFALGSTIKIPTLAFIQRIRDQIKVQRGI